MKIIFLGAPGAGKGTQAQIVSDRLGIPTVSTGAMIRAALKAGTEMGKRAQTYIETGALVPDDVVIGIIRERLAQPDCEKGYILDGFPRTVPQAQALDAMGITPDAVISVEVSDDEIVDRMAGRRVCASCGASYHLRHNPAKDGETCDHCGIALTERADDAPDVVLSRLQVYHDTTEPLKDFYHEKGNLRTVDGVGTVEQIAQRTREALGA